MFLTNKTYILIIDKKFAHSLLIPIFYLYAISSLSKLF